MNNYYISEIIIDGDNGRIEFTVKNSKNNYYVEKYVIKLDYYGIPYLMDIIKLERVEDE